MMFDEQGKEIGGDDYNYQADRNLDPYHAVLSYRTFSREALKEAIQRLCDAGWQLEHYHGTTGAVLIR